ncbi:type III-A CRISPR-associated RAMP protein Csm4 [Tetragenococcus halophilus]|uniref:type III-A CRISPR-associated RAMP protein Csm4 n=1 Tax=Tetragenococcus halophilus TaxID=51669 RepID=UPI00083CC967|nr:type III-A CRISPR-associated RAMP protein Csm4 [Tetragenococcus halophilus]AOF48270.1 CRISPR-associated protein Csm4 [Tetragenococcus halophilus]GMG69747.1 type III-A CRISPR-associated RAMP protein Csm4 [Tetragenococcus halophilus]
MTLKIYKMKFQHAHFGEGILSESASSFDASRLYSALFLEAKKMDVVDEFMKLTQNANFVLSDAFPFIDDQPFLPKPIGYPKVEQDNADDNLKKVRQTAKKLKKIFYLPLNQLELFLKQQANIEELAEYQAQLAEHSYTTQKGVDPFEVGVTVYNSALYVLASQSPLFDQLMDSLQYSGVGGKRSSGLGQYSLEILSLPDELAENLTTNKQQRVMALSTCLPMNQEMLTCLDGANYLLKKSSGFAYSETAGALLRKQDLYKFKAGSTFQTSFTGDIVDVRPDNFPHPVWNFAKGIFYQL